MAQPYYETFHDIGNSGIHIAFYTVPGGYRPLHWHEELEILYPLNVLSDITVEGTKYSLPKKQLMAVESMQVHSTFRYDQTSMFLCIHIARKHFQDCMPDIEDHHILCRPDLISVEKFPAYLEICQLLENMTRLYIQDATAFYLEAEGLTLQVLARLIRDFSTSVLPPDKKGDRLTANRLRDIISYVEEHYQEPVTLRDIADRTGLGKEAFCRFFKKKYRDVLPPISERGPRHPHLSGPGQYRGVHLPYYGKKWIYQSEALQPHLQRALRHDTVGGAEGAIAEIL